MVEMSLPWPPSVNSYWRHPTRGALAGRHLISAEGRGYRQVVAQLKPLEGNLFPLHGRLAIEVQAFPPDRRARDLDNILKSLLDSLTHAGLIEDDSQFDAIAISRRPSAKPGRVDIRIFQLENL